MAKERCKQNVRLNVYISIISSIIKRNCLPKERKRQYYSRYVKTLKINGLIQKKGYSTWELTRLGKEIIDVKDVNKTNLCTIVQPAKKVNKNSEKVTTKFVRTHGLSWKVETPKSILKHQCFKLLEKKGFSPTWTQTKMIKFFLWGHNIKIGSRSILILFDKEIYFKSLTAKQGYSTAIYELKRIISRLEYLLRLNLRFHYGYKFKPTAKHFGNVNNEIAGHYHKNKTFVRVKDQGKEWLIIDFSDKKFIELETVDNNRNIVDNDQIITPFMNTLRSDPDIITRLKNENLQMKELLSQQNKITRDLLNKIYSPDIDLEKPNYIG